MHLKLSSKFLPVLVKEINKNFKHSQIDNLKTVISSFPNSDYNELLESFKKKVNFSIYNYDYYNFNLHTNDNYEINIINWNKFSSSKIHNHSEMGCILKVLEGKLLEERFNNNLEFINKNCLQVGKPYFINNKDVHSIHNIHYGTSYSLHIYSPSNFKAKTFN